MKELGSIQDPSRIYFTIEDFSQYFQMPMASTRVYLSRKVKAKQLLRVRRNLYVFPQAFPSYDQQQLFELANVIQTPSYVSYLTALSFYDLTTQIPSAVIESANPVRRSQFPVASVLFDYHFCQKSFYFGYVRQGSFFIAEPEKALLDSVYLISLGRYALDESALSLKGLNEKKLEKWLKKYPKRFQKFFVNWRNHYENIATA